GLSQNSLSGSDTKDVATPVSQKKKKKKKNKSPTMVVPSSDPIPTVAIRPPVSPKVPVVEEKSQEKICEEMVNYFENLEKVEALQKMEAKLNQVQEILTEVEKNSKNKKESMGDLLLHRVNYENIQKKYEELKKLDKEFIKLRPRIIHHV